MAKKKDDKSKGDKPKRKSKYDEVFKLDEELSFEDALKKIVSNKNKPMDIIELKFTEDHNTHTLPFTDGIFKIRNLQIPYNKVYNSYKIYLSFTPLAEPTRGHNIYFSKVDYHKKQGAYVLDENNTVKNCNKITISILPTNEAIEKSEVVLPVVPEEITLTIDYNLE